jgi:ABC-type phosphate transport system substrate-binding protein
MKRASFSLIIIGLVLVATLYAVGPEIKIIANPSISAESISASDLKEVFLQNKSALPDGSHVQPVLAKGGTAHEAFLRGYLDKTDSALQTYYRGLVFTGKASMPKVAGSDADVVAYVAKTKGAIGYVSASTSLSGVKTLQVK